jgi:hypothetical protein
VREEFGGFLYIILVEEDEEAADLLGHCARLSLPEDDLAFRVCFPALR